MLKTKISIIKWIKTNFKNSNELKDFLEYDWLHQFIVDKRKLFPQYQKQYDSLKLHWAVLHDSVKALPEIEIVECFGNEIHKTKMTPLDYMSNMYYSDIQKRDSLFLNTNKY